MRNPYLKPLTAGLVESQPACDENPLIGPKDVLRCCWDPDKYSLSGADLIRLGRRMSKIHFELTLVPEVLITTRIDPNFYIEKKSHFDRKMKRKMFFAICALALLPWIYANTVMPYPCKFKEFEEQEGNMTMTERALAPEGCGLQDYIRSLRGGGFIGVTLVVLTLMVMCVIAQLTVVFTKQFEKTGNEKWLNRKRLMWKPLLMLWYFKVSLYMPTLKFVNTTNMVPCLYIPPSVLACFTYIALLLEVFALGAMDHALPIGCVAAYAMGELWLHIVAVLMKAPTERHKVMYLAMESFDVGSDDILEKMVHEDHRGDRKSFSSMAAVTIRDLIQLHELKVKGNFDLVTDRLSTEGTVDDVGVITTLLVQAYGGVYKLDLVTGHIERAAKLEFKKRGQLAPPTADGSAWIKPHDFLQGTAQQPA